MQNKYCLQCEKNIICNARKILLEILFAMWQKYCLQCETNIVFKARQIFFAMWQKYCLQCKRNIVWNSIHILFAVQVKYCLQFEANIVCSARQIFFVIRDTYCLQYKTNTAAAKICTLAKIAEVAKLTWPRKIAISDEILQRWKVKMLRLSHDCIMIQTYFCGLFKIPLKLSADFCLNGIRASWPIMHPRICRIDLFPNFL